MIDHYEILRHCTKKIPSKPFQFEESWFQSELYYQLRKFYPLTNDVGVSPNTHKRNLEVPINIEFRDIISNYFYNGINRNPVYRFPDLLIHNLTSRFDVRNQEIVIEIKKTPSDLQILIDLSKLIVYCRGRLCYKKGVLIIYRFNQIGNEKHEINKFLKTFREIEIWVARPNQFPIIYCSTNLIP